jgi:hypothetical protein
LGGLGGLVGGKNEGLAVLAYFQALGTAVEGTYTSEGKEKAPSKRPMLKPRGKVPSKTSR